MNIHLAFHTNIRRILNPKLVLSPVLSAILLFHTCTPTFAEEWEDVPTQNVIINRTTFEDDHFRAWLLNPSNAKGIGADGILTSKELQSTTWLAIQFQQIKSLKGIEYFTNLTFLDVEGNYLKTVDLSKLTKLKNVYLRTNLLESIDFSHNTDLEFIEIFDNRLTSIDVSMLPKLKFLHVDYNRLKELDLSANTKLEGDGFVLNNNMPIEKLTLPVIYDENGTYRTWDSFVISEQDEIEGHASLTWYKDASFTEKVLPNTQQPFDGSTYYAKRNPNAYTISFHGGWGSSGSIPQIQTFWNETITLPNGKNLTKKGYLFDGWTLPNGVKKEADDRVSNLAGKYSNSKKADVYAVWKPINYMIHIKDEKSNLTQLVSATYDNSITLPDAPEPIEDFLFVGWKLPDGTIAKPGTSVKNLTETDGAMTVLEGQWIVDELGICKKEWIGQIKDSVSAILSSSDYYEGVKNEASRLLLQIDAIQSAETILTAKTCYETLDSSIRNLPNIAETHFAFEKQIALSQNIPTLYRDLVTLEDAKKAQSIALDWTDERRKETLLTMILEIQKDASVAYTKEDQKTIANWLSLSSAQIEKEHAHALLLSEASQIIQHYDNFMSTEQKEVGPEYIENYKRLLETIDVSSAAGLLTSYRQNVSKRLALAQKKEEAIQFFSSRFISSYQQKEYSSTNWNKMLRLLNQTKEKLLSLASVEEIDTTYFWNSLNKELSKVPKISPSNSENSVTQTTVTKPKSTSISKIKALKKGFTVTWKKQTKVTGYQIQYSTNKKFAKNTKIITIKTYKTSSKKVTKRKAKKKYYVRIRTYKTVKINKKSKNLYSSWSKGKSIKTKK